MIFQSPPAGGAALWRRLVQVVAGLVLYGFSSAVMIRAVLGLDPWDTLHQGLSVITAVPFGVVVIIVGVGVLLLWIPLRQRLGIGTVLNVLVIGLAIDFFLIFLPAASGFWMGLIFFVIGVALNGLAIALYVGAGLGAGPRDGLMTGIVKRTGKPVWLVRTAIEITVLVGGWMLGGTIGIGTVIYALGIGPVAHVLMPYFALDAGRGAGQAAELALAELEAENPEGH
ncbi:MAG: hypothetical protein JJE28_03610 [Actinomycetales bacterium]|nr:hypothetical protein [Actinomycetales bacterium]